MRIRKANGNATSSSPLLFLTFRDISFFTAGIIATVCFNAAVDSSYSSPSLLTTLTNAAPPQSTPCGGSVTNLFDARTSAQDALGFHPLHIYFGRNDLVTRHIPADGFWVPPANVHQASSHPGTRKWFSQHGQDVAVMKVLQYKRDGFFVDLAANDAVWASNTYTLEQHFGWRGICIEANPIYWHRLAYRHCHAVGAVVGNATQNTEVEMVLSADKVQGPYGGIVGQDFDNKRPKQKPEARYTVPLVTILERFQAPPVIDYLSLDVEGAEWFILHQFPFERYQFLCLTIERPSEQLQQLLQTVGYIKVLDIARGDTLWVHQSLAGEAKEAVKDNPQEISQHNSPNLPMHLLSGK